MMRSHLLKDIFAGRLQFIFAHTYRILLDGVVRSLTYIVTDNSYPDWQLFSKPINNANDEAEKKFSRHQAVRKDVERLLGVLKTRWR